MISADQIIICSVLSFSEGLPSVLQEQWCRAATWGKVQQGRGLGSIGGVSLGNVCSKGLVVSPQLTPGATFCGGGMLM